MAELGGLTARCYREWPAEQSFEQAWDNLFLTAPLATTFHSATWLRRGVGPSMRGGSLRLITVHQAGELLGVLPLQMGTTGFLESAGYAVSDYLDPLVRSDEEGAAWRVILQLLEEQWDSNLKALTLHNVRRDSACRTILPQLAPAAGFVYEEAVTANAAKIALPESWDAYLESLDGHERKEIRRKIRKAETQAAAELVICSRENPHPDLLPVALDLTESADPSKRDWLRDNVRPVMERVGLDLLREGRMRLLVLMLNGAPAASLIDFPSARGPLLYNSGFDPATRVWSPGAVIFALAIKDAVERQCPVFDLLRGDESYKYRLGAVDEPLYRVSLHR